MGGARDGEPKQDERLQLADFVLYAEQRLSLGTENHVTGGPPQWRREDLPPGRLGCLRWTHPQTVCHR